MIIDTLSEGETIHATAIVLGETGVLFLGPSGSGKSGAAFGIYSGKVDDQVYPYIFPQENGNKTDVRWVTFINQDGVGLRITGLPRVDISAWPYTMEDLEAATHHYQLPDRPFYSIQVDDRQRGVGGNNSWGLKPLDQYRLLEGDLDYSFLISPVEASN